MGYRHGCISLHLSSAILKSFESLHIINLPRIPLICKLFLFSSLLEYLNSVPFPPHHPYCFSILTYRFRIVESAPPSPLPSGDLVKLLFLRFPCSFSSSLFLLTGFPRPGRSPGMKHVCLVRIPNHWFTQLVCYSISPVRVPTMCSSVHQLS